MEIGIIMFMVVQLTSSVALPFFLVKAQRKIYQALHYSSRVYDCLDPIVTILAPRTPLPITFFGAELPCIYPDISTPNLISSSKGQVIFSEIAHSIQTPGAHDH